MLRMLPLLLVVAVLASDRAAAQAPGDSRCALATADVRDAKHALAMLEDNAAAEIDDDEVERYAVIRIADEVVIDLMARACGVDYADAALDAEVTTLGATSVPVASPGTLIRTKNTVRPSDAADRAFLEAVLAERRDS